MEKRKGRRENTGGEKKQREYHGEIGGNVGLPQDS
jgi:hypothetical protein